MRRDDDGLLAAIIDSSADAIVSVDRHGSITSWNRSAEALYGYTGEDADGMALARLWPPDRPPDAALAEILAGHRVSYAEATRIRSDGTEVLVGETLSPVLGADGDIVGAAAIARDITERLEAERELAGARRELEANNRRLERSNDELEQFAYIASHDLSEPLRAVSGMVSLLGRRYQGRLDDDADEFIGFAVDGCRRMRLMIDDLLDFSRAGRVDLHVEDVDLAALAEEVAASIADDAGAPPTVVFGDLPVVRADRAQLARVVQNLLANAVKFRRPDVAPLVEVSASRAGDAWRIEIADNGIGIAEEHRSRIFRMFQRLHPSDVYAGSGIGLSIAERIVDRHGGRIGVEANPVGGATFWFTLADHPEEEIPWRDD